MIAEGDRNRDKAIVLMSNVQKEEDEEKVVGTDTAPDVHFDGHYPSRAVSRIRSE